MRRFNFFFTAFLMIFLLSFVSVDSRADDAQIDAFVKRLYSNILGRTADQSGLEGWRNKLKNEGWTATQVAQFFYNSDEFKSLKVSDSDFLDKSYQTFFNRAADAGGKAFWLDQLKNSGKKRESIFYNFALSDEFKRVCDGYGVTAYNGNDGIKAFTVRFYNLILNRKSDPGGLDYWVKQLKKKKATGANIAKSFFASKEYTDKNPSNDDFINAVYKTMFDRTADSGGFNYWKGLMDKGASKNDIIDKMASTNEFKAIEKKYLEISEESPFKKSKIIASIDLSNDGKTVGSLAIRGDILFAGASSYEDEKNSVYIIDVTDKYHPVILSTIKPKDLIRSLAVDSNTLYIANNQKGLTVVDISDLKNPIILKSLDSGYGRGVYINGSNVYVASGYDGVNIFDTNTLTKTAHIDVAGSFTDSIAVDPNSGKIYTSDSYGNEVIISDLTSKEEIARLKKSGSHLYDENDMIIKNGFLYTANGLHGFDIFNLSTNSLVSSTPTLKNGSFENIYLSGDNKKAYISAWGLGVAVYDIANKSNPKLLEVIETPGAAKSSVLSKDGKYLFTADHNKGVQIIKLNSVSNPPSSKTVSMMNLSDWDVYGTVTKNANYLIIGDEIGSDPQDLDQDGNKWNILADKTSTKHDYDAVVSKRSFTPPLKLKFSAILRPTSLGYNLIGLAYKNPNFTGVNGEGLPIIPYLALFAFRWEDNDNLNVYTSKEGYKGVFDDDRQISAENSRLSGNFEIDWDGHTVKYYYNSEKIYEAPLEYDSSKEVKLFSKTYEHEFSISAIEIESI